MLPGRAGHSVRGSAEDWRSGSSSNTISPVSWVSLRIIVSNSLHKHRAVQTSGPLTRRTGCSPGGRGIQSAVVRRIGRPGPTRRRADSSARNPRAWIETGGERGKVGTGSTEPAGARPVAVPTPSPCRVTGGKGGGLTREAPSLARQPSQRIDVGSRAPQQVTRIPLYLEDARGVGSLRCCTRSLRKLPVGSTSLRSSFSRSACS